MNSTTRNTLARQLMTLASNPNVDAELSRALFRIAAQLLPAAKRRKQA